MSESEKPPSGYYGFWPAPTLPDQIPPGIQNPSPNTVQCTSIPHHDGDQSIAPTHMPERSPYPGMCASSLIKTGPYTNNSNGQVTAGEQSFKTTYYHYPSGTTTALPPGSNPSHGQDMAPGQPQILQNTPYPNYSATFSETPSALPSAPVIPPTSDPVSYPGTFTSNSSKQSQSIEASATAVFSSTNKNVPVREEMPVVSEFDWAGATSTTASSLASRAVVVGGHEGFKESPLWVIRAWYQGDMIPGKFSISNESAYVIHEGKEITVDEFEVLIASPENLRWIQAADGNVPLGAIEAGKTISGETLYIGRARHMLSLIPGKVHPSRKKCYISSSGSVVTKKSYKVLCRVD